MKGADELRREERREIAGWVFKFAVAGIVGLTPWAIGVVLLIYWLIEALQ